MLAAFGDDRDGVLNGYGEFVRVFDLKAPDGYGDMETFNAELSRSLERAASRHARISGPVLAGGTQTSSDLFAARHPLVERLRRRIEDRYRASISPQMRAPPDHPLIARRRREYAFSGSWSSRLRSGGFHINHLHPGGWISSCYYVDVPAVVSDDAIAARAGSSSVSLHSMSAWSLCEHSAGAGTPGTVSFLYLAWHHTFSGRAVSARR